MPQISRTLVRAMPYNCPFTLPTSFLLHSVSLGDKSEGSTQDPSAADADATEPQDELFDAIASFFMDKNMKGADVKKR